MRSIELFTGAGGLAIGTGMAGFEHDAVIEFDHYDGDVFDGIAQSYRFLSSTL